MAQVIYNKSGKTVVQYQNSSDKTEINGRDEFESALNGTSETIYISDNEGQRYVISGLRNVEESVRYDFLCDCIKAITESENDYSEGITLFQVSGRIVKGGSESAILEAQNTHYTLLIDGYKRSYSSTDERCRSAFSEFLAEWYNLIKFRSDKIIELGQKSEDFSECTAALLKWESRHL